MRSSRRSRIAFLEREGRRKTGYTWYHKTQWVNPEKAAWLTHLTIIQMDALWTIARCHYLGGPPPDAVELVSNQALDAFRNFTRGGGVQSFRFTVARETLDSLDDPGLSADGLNIEED